MRSRTIEIIWGVSRGRNTAGYTTCSLREDGKRIAACNGGGYDMRGTVVGNWLTYRYRDRLLALKPEQMEKHSRWQPDEHAFICRTCLMDRVGKELEPVTGRTREPYYKLDEYPKCPSCNAEMSRDTRAGKREDEGRYFYGLTYHDPNYDPSKAVIGKDATDRTIGGEASGMTVGEAEAAGKSLGLERYQAIYSASSKFPTERHIIPSIDGACGMSSVQQIAKAIGISLRQVVNRSKLDVYEVIDEREEVTQ